MGAFASDETPTIATSSYGSGNSSYIGEGVGSIVQLNTMSSALHALDLTEVSAFRANNEFRPGIPIKPKEEIEISNRRYVQVFIADPNENLPLENCLVYAGSPKLTDLTDQELFFELDIKQLLNDHNIKRVKVRDKKVKDRTELLEAAKVRDLKMTVVEIAKF